MRQTEGTMLVACNLVHLDPSWINLLLRALLDHRLADKRQEEEWKEQLAKYSAHCGIPFPELARLHKSFIRTGRLTEEYLQFVWREVAGLDLPKILSRMIETMSTYGVMFVCDPSRGVERQLLVPARLPRAVDADTLAELKSAFSTGVEMRFIIRIFSKYTPAGIIAEFIAGFCWTGRIIFRDCWSRGAAFIMNSREHLVCLHQPTAETEAHIDISIAGSTQETVADHGSAVVESLYRLLLERYPGLLFDTSGDPCFITGTDAWQNRLEDHLESLLHKVCVCARAVCCGGCSSR